MGFSHGGYFPSTLDRSPIHGFFAPAEPFDRHLFLRGVLVCVESAGRRFKAGRLFFQTSLCLKVRLKKHIVNDKDA